MFEHFSILRLSSLCRPRVHHRRRHLKHHTTAALVIESLERRLLLSVDPVFSQPTYEFDVAEDASNGTIIGQVSATDPQSLPITYSLDDGHDNQLFSINPTTGEISLQWPMFYYEIPSFSLTVYATNSENNTTSAVLEIEVEPIDHTPNGNDAPAVGSLSFQVTEHGYGTAFGELIAPIIDDDATPSTFFLEIDIDNNEIIDWYDWTVSENTQVWAEIELAYGENTVAVRLIEHEWATGNVIVGSWTVQVVEVDPPANDPASLTDLAFMQVDDEGYGVFGYLHGTIVDETRWFGSYEIEIDLTGNGIADDASTFVYPSDAETFAYELEAQIGEQTVWVRILEYDVHRNVVLDGDWTSLTFTPVLPLNEPPVIQLAEWDAEEDPGYGLMGDMFVEFADHTNFDSTYELEVDTNGNGYANYVLGSSLGAWFQYSQFVEAEEGLQVRVIETDRYNRVFASGWVGVTLGAGGERNVAPVFGAAASNPIPLSKQILANGLQVWAHQATDANAGDTLRYSLTEPQWKVPMPGGGQIWLFHKRPPKKGLSIDSETGVVTITDLSVIENAYKTDFKYTFTVTVTDGKETASVTVMLHDNHEVYIAKIQAHLDAWLPKVTSNVINVVHSAANEATDKLKAFIGERFGVFTGTVTIISDLTWALAGYSYTIGGVHLAVAAVVSRIAINAVASHAHQGHAAIIAEVRAQIDAVRDQDIANAESKYYDELDALPDLIAEIENLSPDLKAKRTAEYFESLRSRLVRRDEPVTVNVDNIYGELLLEFTKKNGWKLKGSMWTKNNLGKYWFSPSANWPWLTANNVAAELNAIGYYKGRNYRINVAP